MMRTSHALFAVAAASALSMSSACASSGAMPSRAEEPSVHGSHSDNEVAMSLIAYRPRQLVVPAGTTVTWRQLDAGVHTVTSGSAVTTASGSVDTEADGTFDSGELERGESFTFTFDAAGSYAYFCSVHPATMRGRVKAT